MPTNDSMTRKKPFVVVAALVLLLCVSRAEAQDCKFDALDAMTEGRYAAAAELYRECLSRYPDDASLQMNFAECVLAAELQTLVPSAIDCARRALRFTPTARGREILGSLLLLRADRISDQVDALPGKIRAYLEAAEVLQQGTGTGKAKEANQKAANARARLSALCSARLQAVEERLGGTTTFGVLRDCDQDLAWVRRLQPDHSRLSTLQDRVSALRTARAEGLRNKIASTNAQQEWEALLAAVAELRTEYPQDRPLADVHAQALERASWERACRADLKRARAHLDYEAQARLLHMLRDSAAVALERARQDSLIQALKQIVSNSYYARDDREAERWLLQAQAWDVSRDQIVDGKMRFDLFWRRHGSRVSTIAVIVLVFMAVLLWFIRRTRLRHDSRRLAKVVTRLLSANRPFHAFERIKSMWVEHLPSRNLQTVGLLEDAVRGIASSQARRRKAKPGGKTPPPGALPVEALKEVTDFLKNSIEEIDNAEARVRLVWLEIHWRLQQTSAEIPRIQRRLNAVAAAHSTIDGIEWLAAILPASLLRDLPDRPVQTEKTDWSSGRALPWFPNPVAGIQDWNRQPVRQELTERLLGLLSSFPERKAEVIDLLPQEIESHPLPRWTIARELLDRGDEQTAQELLRPLLAVAAAQFEQEELKPLILRWADRRAASPLPLDLEMELPALAMLCSKMRGQDWPSLGSVAARLVSLLAESPDIAAEKRIALEEQLPPDREDVQDLLAAEYVARGKPQANEKDALSARLDRAFDDATFCHYLRVLALSRDAATLLKELRRRGGRMASLALLEACMRDILSALLPSPSGQEVAALSPGETAAARRAYQLARRGDAKAQFEFAIRCHTGRGVPQSDLQAAEFLRLAAEQGHAAARCNLGYLLERGMGVDCDFNLAAEAYRQAADLEDPNAQTNLAHLYAKGLGVGQDFQEAIKWYRRAAEHGHPRAQSNLGVFLELGPGQTAASLKLYRQAAERQEAIAQYNLGVAFTNGTGIRQDYSEAVTCFRLAAEQDHAAGQCGLGFMYDLGLGVKQDFAEAAKWYRRSAQQSHSTAQTSMGFLYEHGLGIEQDYSKAMHWYRLAADQEYAPAAVCLGDMLEDGRSKPAAHGVVADDAQAAAYFRQAADLGDARGQFRLGVLYATGRVVNQDRAEALKWYNLAADQQYGPALYNLAFVYKTGDGVDADKTKAMELLRHAADVGDTNAMRYLGRLYANGDTVPHDDKEALKFYRLAAEKGDALAQVDLGKMHEQGAGTPQDYAEAVKWYRLAAQQDEPIAQFNLAVLHTKGLGVAQSDSAAFVWFSLAANRLSSGNLREQAVKNRQAAAKRLSEEQRKAAQRIVDLWKPDRSSKWERPVKCLKSELDLTACWVNAD